MLGPLVLLLFSTPPSSLSPEAAAHNTEAMRLYDAGLYAPAVDYFYLAYQAMPDPRGSFAGRELMIGSLRATLVQLYRDTGEPAHLCRLQAILRSYIDTLSATFPEDPWMLEIQSSRARNDEVAQQLAAYGPDICAPPPLLTAPPPVVAPPPAKQAPTPPSPTGRPQLIAGAVVLPLGLAALGALAGVASTYRRNLTAADDLHAELTARPCTDDDRDRMRELLASTRRQEGAMIALGIVGGALITTGTALLIRGSLQRRRTRLALDLRPGHAAFAITGAF